MGYKCFFCEHDYGPHMQQSAECVTCHNYNNFQVKKRMSDREKCRYEQLLKEETKIKDQNTNYDKNTALAMLKELTKHMSLSRNMFGDEILVIRRDIFETVRKAFLDS